MRKSGAARREEIVETAIALADEMGPDRLTTEAIARHVGISQPAIFRHFATKGALWQAVAEHVTGHMERRWAEALTSEEEPVPRLRAVVLTQLSLITTTPALPAILFSRELHVENEPLRAVFVRTMNRFHRILRDQVELAKGQGRFRSDLPANDAAFLIIGLVQSLAMRWSLGGRSDDLVALGDHLLALQLAGFKDR